MRYLISVIACASLASCGGDDEDGGGGGGGAEARCVEFVDTWCQQAIGCLVEVGTLTDADRAENLRVCRDTGAAAGQCDRAVDTEPELDECLMSITDMPCSEWDVPESDLDQVTPPDICRGVILVR